MKKRKERSPLIADIERPHPTVAEGIGDGLGEEPLNIRLGDSWSDFVRGADAPADQDKPKDSRSRGGVPLLDDMKGILQWE
jgi:hypothetical protein